MSEPDEKPTVFQLAWERYLKELDENPKKKHKRSFIVKCRSDPDINAQAINELIKSTEEKHSESRSRKLISGCLSPIVKALLDFNEIINTLISTNPMPLAIIWGSLKIVLNGLHRYQSLFETIKRTLEKLRIQIRRINIYDNLYGEDDDMQSLLCQSYIDMFRFWAQVDRECDRCAFSSAIRASVCFSTNKLNVIVEDIKESVDNIEKQAPAVEAVLARDERRDATIERDAQAKERRSAEKERKKQDTFREEQREKTHVDRLETIRNWLGSAEANLQNYERHERNQRLRMEGTCHWIHEEPKFIAWRNETALSSILWVHSTPGAGKSILCSTVIGMVQDVKDPAAFYFYDFAQDRKPIEILRLLAHQLLRTRSVRAGDKILDDLWGVTQLEPCSQNNIQNMIKTLVKDLPKVYFFLDGLDESQETGVLDFLVTLASEHPKSLHLWCSSQNTASVRGKLQAFPTIEINDSVGQDITSYLSSCLRQTQDSAVDIADHATALAKRANCNFLWASLMIKHIQTIASSPAEIQEIIEKGLPDDLNDYYRNKLIERIPKSQRPIISKIFSLVVFTKRPLRVEELREALGLLQSKNPSQLKEADLPFYDKLLSLLPPLIEVVEVKGPEHTDRFCRLFHSTVRDFLLSNPEVFCGKENPTSELRISPDVAANACLLYLSQSRYDKMLTSEEASIWVDKNGEPVSNHHLLLYAAKYWDRHLDDVPEFQDRTIAFILSPNFRTCVQVQSLWIDLQFCVFRVLGHDDKLQFLRRVFPRWLVDTPLGRKLWSDYRNFLHEWKYFLSCESCGGDSNCPTLPYIGDINRCWWNALGQSNFLSGFECRYRNFILQQNDNIGSTAELVIEGVSQTGDELLIVSLQSWPPVGQETFEVVCETWSLPGHSEPSCRLCQVIQVTQTDTSWQTYVKAAVDEKLRIGTAPPIAVGTDCQTLRIGVQMFRRGHDGHFLPIPGLVAAENKQRIPYVEEFARRGDILVLATRTRFTPQSNLPKGEVNAKAKAQTKKNWWDSDEEEEEEEEDGKDSSFSSEQESEEEAYESWSEGSTLFSGSDHFPYDDDEVGPWADRLADRESKPEGSPGSDSEDEGDPALSYPGINDPAGDSGSEDSYVEPKAILRHGGLRDEDDYDWQNLSDGGPGGIRLCKSKTRYRVPQNATSHEAHASIAIFDTSSEIPTRLFHLTRPLTFKLYGSPPVVHPTKPLAVWPLNGGDVLFVDFVQKTYFIRRLRPSTYQTRHIFMKCHFSPCGRFLHIAGLEAQSKVTPKTKDVGQARIKLATLVSTYLLSSKKTPRSPPVLIHRTRIQLGSTSLLSVTRLPYTMTWTPDDVYLTCSDSMLRVYRVPLFRTEKGIKGNDEPPVLMPRYPIFLPETAEARNVYYFPPRVDGKDVSTDTGRIIIGGEVRVKETASETMEFVLRTKESLGEARAAIPIPGMKGELAPPVGCYIGEQDFGGWRTTSDRSEIPGHMGVGCLSRRLEKFNPDDDCDLEAYIY